MRFVDQCKVKVIAGDGGNGSVAFRREKFIPLGGPSGGDGGRGGDVIFEGDEGMSTLLDFTHSRVIRSERGEHGHGSDCYGRQGKEARERVPVGTQIKDENGELIADITAHGQEVIVAKGGKGGRGNIHFATSIDRAPRRAEKGEPGQSRELTLELKIMADVGLLGFPNVGKSTFVSTVSAARPKIADYPFTTLVPSLGMVSVGGGVRAGGASFVIADIPGLIPGASEGVGLGIRFLKHVERTRVLLHLVSLDPTEGREPLADYRAIRRELERYSPELARRPEVVVLSKADLTEVRDAFPALEKRFAKAGVTLRLVSSATREHLDPLVNELFQKTKSILEEEDTLPPAADDIVLPEEAEARKKAKPKAKPGKTTSTSRSKTTSTRSKTSTTRSKTTSTRSKTSSTRSKTSTASKKSPKASSKTTSTRSETSTASKKSPKASSKTTSTRSKTSTASKKSPRARSKTTTTRSETSTASKKSPKASSKKTPAASKKTRAPAKKAKKAAPKRAQRRS